MKKAEMNPIEEIRAVRAARMKQFNTLEAYAAYLETLPSVDEMLARLREKAKSPSRRRTSAKRRVATAKA